MYHYATFKIQGQSYTKFSINMFWMNEQTNGQWEMKYLIFFF